MQSASRHAERVLFGTTLEDKLAPWPDVDVRATRPVDVALTPARPACLALPDEHRRLPSVWKEDLQSDGGRIRVLHELANHELQATELMAMALLRWPDAPAGFRRALVATLRDEQRHCQLYIDRLRACGGEVGDVPVSRFFWDTLGPVTDPAAFVAGMSLCFEAANLDFCRTWRERFAQAGDADTAEVLDVVYADEIRHVATGLVWFGRWTEGDRVQSWSDALPPPLTPARSRGPRFDAEGRRRAGFTDAEVQALRVAGGSRGRPGRVLWFDSAVEDRVSGRPVSSVAARVQADLATLPMFLCASEDTVVAPAPDAAFCAALADAGFDIPRFVPDLNAAALGPHPVRSLEPWGPVPDPVRVEGVDVLDPSARWTDGLRELSSKVSTAEHWASLADLPSLATLGEVWRQPQDPGPGNWVLKAPFSASGTERVRGRGPLTDDQARWLARQLDRWGAVVWQPWYERVLDLSVHVSVGDDTVDIDGITRFTTSAQGVYTGAWLGRWTRGLAPDLQRVIHGGAPETGLSAVQPVLEEAARRAGLWAREVGFRGPLSIDAAVVRTSGGLRIHPWLETNARRTLGRVALSLAGRVSPRANGWWHVQRATPSLRAELAQACIDDPVQCRHGRIERGTLLTTPMRVDSGLLTWMSVSPPAA